MTITTTDARLSHRKTRRLLPLRTLACSLLLGNIVSPLAYAATPTAPDLPPGFDLDYLKDRGLDPAVADFFREAARFRPGVNVVSLFVNGNKRGRADAHFNAQGELCFDKELLDKAGLVVPKQTLGTPASPSASSSAVVRAAAGPVCYDLKAAFPEMQIELRPGKEEVSLVVPTDALRPSEQDVSGYGRGGTAAILNYELLGLSSRFATSSSRFMSANAELGFNFEDWIVRSREVYTAQDASSQRQHLYAYAQHTLVDYKSIFQGGQINIANSAFSGGAITGVQLIPESALMGLNRNNVMVEGIAQSQARVEVRQAGALIYSTVVPAGPFGLADLPLLNGNSDLEVTIVEANNAQRKFIVPAASLHSGSLGNQRGYSFALGKLRSVGNSNARQPWVITGTGGWKLGKDGNLSAGLMSATGYQAASWGADTRVLDNTSVSLQQRLAHASREGVRGTQLTLSGSSILTARLSGSLSATQQTLGYRDLSDTTIDNTAPDWQSTRYRGQYTASLSWTDVAFGGFNLSYSRSTQFTGASTQRLFGAWGKTFEFGTVSLNVDHSMGGSNQGPTANTYYLTLSIPLGKRSVRTYVNNSSGYARMGASVNEQVNDYATYMVSAERNTQNQETDYSGQLALLPRYAQVNLGYAHTGAGADTYSGGLRGGVVMHQGGLTFSPYPVQDTFGILSVGDVSGVKVDTPYGPVWTDPWGQAVISQLPPYVSSRVEINTKSLPRNVDIKNGYKVVEPGRGSVNMVNFDVIKVRRILLNTKGPNGEPLPKGAFVLDADNQFVTTVVDDGQIFLNGSGPSVQLHVALPGNQHCTLRYTLPEKPDLDMFYETTDAVCQPDVQANSKGRSYARS
ncbi:fimbrial biogenesis usher protein [Herbaspirillum rhizosphaerae]|uniref:fimbrial biogenesis usher protein n=1 Tax=Herbaspirillum rhizosphaerae TaxID=346179 RepID=UPI00142F3753|nr:fimbrial biogenesis usher protein [Herbaspirillum rhizosphaerae]